MDDINQIIANLTPQDMEMLRGVAASILGDGVQGSAPGAAFPPGAQPTPQPKPGSANSAVQQLTDTVAGAQNMQNLLSGLEGLNFGKADFEMMMKAKSIFDRMNRSSNKNVDLIRALKPHLSPKSQNKADQALATYIIRLARRISSGSMGRSGSPMVGLA